jgi:dienelactone hydrolase
MESFDRNVDGYYDVADQLPQYLQTEADRQFAEAERERATLDSKSAVEDRRDRVHAQFNETLGGLPETKCDLCANRTGTLNRNGYAVEKVVFQSLPEFYVTTNLYLPADRDGPVPGILFFCGHADVGKAAGLYQQTCIELARNGFVVLAVDPIGQGERHQFYDPELDEYRRGNLLEHTYLAHQCALAGTNLAQYFVWDGIRAFDYLAGRPEVDETRIGATGNSGGGMQTAYQMLADDRLAAAAPCCFVTSKEDYMKTGQAQDGEQILWRAIERGPRYDDFLTAFAPKPVRVGASQSDFLCIEGTHRTYERARKVYALFDAEEAIDLTVSSTTHGLDPVLREAVVNWFRQHLRDTDPTHEANDPETEDPETLQCFPDGEVNAAYPDARGVPDFTRDAIATVEEPPADIEGSSDDQAGSPYSSRLRARVRDRFDLNRERVSLFPRVIDETQGENLVWEKVFFRSEADVVTTGVLARRADLDPTSSTPTVVLLDHGTDDLPAYRDDVATVAAERGVALVFDPRGVGGVRARDVNTPLANGGEYFDYHGTEYKLNADALMLGTSLVALRTFDVLRAAEYLRNRFGDVDLGVVGADRGAIHALYASAADSSFRSILVEAVPSFRERATDPAASLSHGLKMHDVIDGLDVPHLLAALADRDVEQVTFPDDGLPTEALTR